MLTLFCSSFFFLLIDIVDTKENSTVQHIPFEVVDPSDLDCSLCMRCVLFSQISIAFQLYLPAFYYLEIFWLT